MRDPGGENVSKNPKSATPLHYTGIQTYDESQFPFPDSIVCPLLFIHVYLAFHCLPLFIILENTNSFYDLKNSTT